MASGILGSDRSTDRAISFQNKDLLNKPLDVSYFVNNVCNLKCRHCYVGYEEGKGELSILEWTKVFDRLIDMGALTFGNVGKEPLLASEKTVSLLNYFAQKREEKPKLRFGFVTNGTLLEGKLVGEIAKISPDYIDVSLDGAIKEHDYIRGKGNYARTLNNLRKLPYDLKQNIFISYTLMNHNKYSFENMIKEIKDIGIKKFLVSPYVSTPSSNGDIALSDERIVDFYEGIIKGQEVDFSKLGSIEILLKSDYDAQKPLIDKLVERKAIDINQLLIDEYGVLFNRYSGQNDSTVVINYMPFSDTFSKAVRISHDGYVSGCLEMFHKDYPQRTKGNLKKTKIEEILNV